MGKRGRKKKQGVKRTDSGRVSRAKTAYCENAEPIRLRMVKLGLSEADARDQKAGSVHGLMFLRRQIGEHQYEAGEFMLKVRKAYLQALKAPNALANGQGAGGDAEVSESYQAWVEEAIGRYRRAETAVMNMQVRHRGAHLWGALDYMLFRNEHYPHMEADFSLVLTALAQGFGLTKPGKSAYKGDEILRSQICA